jgi:conjugative transposon TraM protein
MKANVKKKKMMLVLPFLITPFLTMAFYALGGGQIAEQQQKKDLSKGLNLKLPDANLKEENLLDKLSFYDKADKDSAKLAEWMRNDPFYKKEFTDLENITQSTASKYNQRLNISPYEKTNDDPSEKLVQKLSQLQKELNSNSTAQYQNSTLQEKTIPGSDFEGDVDRLETMMKNMNKGNDEDPEIKQLSGVMDKILDIQHPERVKERFKEKKPLQTNFVWKVSERSGGDTASNGFYSWAAEARSKNDNAFEAVVNENQIMVNGSIIKLRLLQDMYIGVEKIPEGNFLYGIVALNGERLNVEINSIRSGNSLYDVKMEVYDMDGLQGIHIPGAITRDAAKQSADNSLQLMELSTLDPSLKAQATAAGIGSIKNLLSKKIKLVKVMVKAGYKILLKNKSNLL